MITLGLFDLKSWYAFQDKTKPTSLRVFALLDFFCKPVSFLGKLSIPLVILAKWMDISVPTWFSGYVQPVLVSAAVGYLTNWLAIEMLFKPYERTKRHLYAWMTCFYWQQGLIPKNKAEIAKTLAQSVSTDLLPPEKIADDLCKFVSDALDTPESRQQLQDNVRNFVLSIDEQITTALLPVLEKGIMAQVDQWLTTDKIRGMWDAWIEPRLASPTLANFVISKLDAWTRSNSANIRRFILDGIQSCHVKDAFYDTALKIAATNMLPKLLSEQKMDGMLNGWLDDPANQLLLQQRVSSLIEAGREWMHGQDDHGELARSIASLREELKGFLHQWLHEQLTPTVHELLQAPALWEGLGEALNQNRGQLNEALRSNGVRWLTEKLDIENRVMNAVNQQNMEDFHDMIDRVVANHLSALQVLGFVFGGIAGILMLFTR